jgi:hypothetical protein
MGHQEAPDIGAQSNEIPKRTMVRVWKALCRHAQLTLSLFVCSTLCCHPARDVDGNTGEFEATPFFMRTSISVKQDVQLGGESRRLYMPFETSMFLEVPGWTPLQAMKLCEKSPSFAAAYGLMLEIYAAIENKEFEAYKQRGMWVEFGTDGPEFSNLNERQAFLKHYWDYVLQPLAVTGTGAAFQIEDFHVFEIRGIASGTRSECGLYVVIWVDEAHNAWNILGNFSGPMAFPLNVPFASAGTYISEPPIKGFSRIIAGRNGLRNEPIIMWMDCFPPHERQEFLPAMACYIRAVDSLDACVSDGQWNANACLEFLDALSGDDREAVTGKGYDYEYFEELPAVDFPGWKAWLDRMKAKFPPYPLLGVDCGNGLLIIIASDEPDGSGNLICRFLREIDGEWKIVNLVLETEFERFLLRPEVKEQLRDLMTEH